MQQPDTYSPDMNAKLREEIDAELAILYDRVRVLHTKRNTLSFLYHLPPELLVRIFSEYQEDVKYSRFLDDAERFGAWIKVLQISHHLREVVLQSPELWSDIVINDTRWVSMFVENSGSHDLSVRLRLHDEQNSLKPLKQVTSALDRISTLSLYINQHDWENLLAAFKKPAPRLTAFRLYIDDVSSNSPPSLPIDLFSETHPNLKGLVVYSCNVDLRAPLFTMTNLTNLSITSPANGFLINEILPVLRCQLALHSLRLHHALTTGGANAGHPIPLPNLTLLELKHKVNLGVNNDLLASLILPETAEIDLSFYAGEFTAQNLAGVMDLVKTATRNPSLVLRNIEFDFNSPWAISLTCMKQPLSTLRNLSSPLTTLKLEFSLNRSAEPENPEEQWFLKLPRWLLAPLEVLRLYCGRFDSRKIWSHISRNTPNLTQLCVRVQDSGQLVQYLGLPFRDLGDSPALSMAAADKNIDSGEEVDLAFPALKRLTLDDPLPESLLALSHVLAARRQRGVGLDELSIIWPRRDDTWLEQVESMFRGRVGVLRRVDSDDKD